jgi:hypothetical protein
LRDIPDSSTGHPIGCPFLTAYQIAIEFALRHPDEAEQLGFPIGGAGVGQRNSLAQYLAGQLSRNIERLQEIEGGFLSNQHLHDISFNAAGEIIHSSLTDSGYTLSMFRLRDQG